MEINKDITKDEIKELMLEHGLNIEDVLEVLIEANGIIGVGLISLANNISDHIKEQIRS